MEKPVFLCELEENERDPLFTHIATSIYISPNDAREVTKTMYKNGRTYYALMSPPSIEQMKVMMKVKMKVSRQSCSKFIDKSIDEVDEIMDERIRMIGPIPRYVFGEELFYKAYVQSIATQAKYFWRNIKELEMLRIPEHVYSVAAPYVREGVDNPMSWESCFVIEDDDSKIEYDIYQFRFLSDYCLKLVSENVQNVLQLELLSNYKFDYQIADGIMINGGIMTPSHIWEDSIYLRSRWEFYKDPGFRTTFTTTHSLSEKAVANIPYCSKTSNFIGQVYQHAGDIRDIDSEYLMVAKTRNYLLGECFSVDHKNKKIYFWQSTSSGDLTAHPVKSTTLSKVMNGLGMLDKEKEASKYKLVIVFCSDCSRETTHGTKFMVERINETVIQNINKPKISFDDCTLQEWQKSDKTGMAEKIETIIAKVCYYPNLKQVV